ncbi:MAG: hypothetical protein KGI27_12210, partial [Thaumarchaeota archaeon]|nr:hypothetical protein [Nitrososphaerota archaeon]
MYNNILRKVTSLSLLTILLASSAVLALPNAMPAAHAQVASHPNLFVSAENSQYNNYFAGPQVVQVVVSDPNINRLDQKFGEPVVTVNGKRLRMAQGTDGNWYGYFADRNQAEIASNTANHRAAGLNFGGFCSSGTISGIDFGSQSKGFTVANGAFTNAVYPANGTKVPIGALTTAACSGAGNGTVVEHVVRENKTLNAPGTGQGGYNGDGVLVKAWPVIQLFDFSAIPTPVTVDYQAAGGDQIVNLTFDRIPSNLISVTTDRTAYPENAAVFLTMNDPQLNIDPTEEDSWTWGSSPTNNTLYYEAFDRNGQPDADKYSSAMQNLVGNLTSMMFNHNGKFTFSPSAQTPVVNFQANGKQQLNMTSGAPGTVRDVNLHFTAGSQPITFIEQGGVNTGVFGNWDGGKKTNIITLDSTSIRGQSDTYKYNDIAGSIVGGFSFGSITMTATNGTWASGQRIPITLTDMDANKNSKITEHLNFYDRNVERITTMKIGHPFTLAGLSPESGSLFATQPKINATGFLSFHGVQNATDPNIAVDESFSGRPVFTWQNATGTAAKAITILNGGGFLVDTNTNVQSLFQTIHNTNSSATATTRFQGFNFLNYDFRSFTSLNGATGADPTAVNVYLVYNPTNVISTATTGPGAQLPILGSKIISLVNGSNLQNFVNLNATTANGVANSGVRSVISGSQFDKKIFSIPSGSDIGFMFLFNNTGETVLPGTGIASTGGEQSIATPVATDFFSIGIIGDGTDNSQRINNAIYRWELEETGDNTGVFTGTNQFVMLNQVNIFDPHTYANLRTINHDVFFAAIQDMLQSEARAPQATYLDLGADGVNTQISAQQDIPTHSGTVSFDQKTYKVADTVTITVNDPDLNTNNDLVVVYTTVGPAIPVKGIQGPTTDTVGVASNATYSDGRAIGRMLDVQFGQQDIRWTNSTITGINTGGCAGFTDTTAVGSISLSDSGFSLVETAAGSGIFTGSFEIPGEICQNGNAVIANGLNMKVNYVDFRDESGKLVEVSDNAGIRGNTGSIKLDKAVYPVPFGGVGAIGTTAAANFDPATVVKASSENGVFPLHRDLSGTGIAPTSGSLANHVFALPAGVVIVHARVNDPDYSLAATGTSTIAASVVGPANSGHGPVAFQISRQGQSVLLATAGGPAKTTGLILNLNGAQLPAKTSTLWNVVPDLGPMVEISPGAGIFQADLPIELTDGPLGTDCPTVDHYDSSIKTGTPGFGAIGTRFANTTNLTGNYCVRQGDVLTVTYYDTSDASGNPQTVTDSATFDLRNGVLQSDKSVYI